MMDMTQARFDRHISRKQYIAWLRKQEDSDVRSELGSATSARKYNVPASGESIFATMLVLVLAWNHAHLVYLTAFQSQVAYLPILGCLILLVALGMISYAFFPKAWAWMKWNSIRAECYRELTRRIREKRIERANQEDVVDE